MPKGGGDGVLLVIIGGGGVLVFGGSSTRGGDGLNRTFGRPIGRPKVRRADKYAEPIGTPNPGTVKSGGPLMLRMMFVDVTNAFCPGKRNLLTSMVAKQDGPAQCRYANRPYLDWILE